MHFLILIMLALCVGATGGAQAAGLALVGGKLYASPDAAAAERATILVEEGVIAAVGGPELAVPEGYEVLDVSGQVVVAGFWNSHVHFLEEPYRQAARKPAAGLSAALAAHFTRWGFTTVFDVASLPGDAIALRKRIALGEVIGPQILTVDAPFFPDHGTPVYVKDLFARLKVPTFEVKDAAAARARAAAQLGSGADGVKVFAGAIVAGEDGGIGVLPMKVPIARAVAAEAHKAGKPSFAHPTDFSGLQVAIDSGVDVLVHTTPNGGPWSAAFAKSLVAEDMALIPTLTLVEVEARREGLPDAILARGVAAASQQVKIFLEQGGQLLFGTDAGYTDVYDPLREYQLMAAAGMDWRQILASLTTHPSKRFGQSHRKGRVVAGMDADFVVLQVDPGTKVDAFAKVALTIRAGRVIHRP